MEIMTSRKNVASYGTINECNTPLLSPEIPIYQTIALIDEDHSKSSTVHTTLNAINVMMGMGILSLPYAFSLVGWLLGISCILLAATLTSFTAKLLGKCYTITQRQSSTQTITYSDIGEHAFGYRGRIFISFLFFLELFCAASAMIVLTCDSLISMYPNFNATYLKIGIVLMLSPATFLRTFRYLAVSSVIGVAASFSVVSIIVWEGSNVGGPPGSIINPEPTTLYPHGNFANIGMAFGLIFVGFDGHSVFPSILRDLKKKTSFDTAMNWTFAFNLLVYLTIATCGYLMFGSETLPEIGLNLSEVERFSGFLVAINTLLTALNSMTKYPLYVNPLVSYLEKSISTSIPLRPYFCVALNSALLSTAIMIPSFHKLMGLVGASFTCVVAIIFPCACYLKLEEERKTFTRGCCWIVMMIGFVVGVIGTWGTIMH